MVVKAHDGLARGFGEQRGNDRMDDAGEARANHPGTDDDCSRSMLRPAHTQRPGVILEQLREHFSLSRHVIMVAPAGLEPATFGLGNRCSILLSYGAILQAP